MRTTTNSDDDWDVTHGPSDPGLYWTTTNVGEAFPGVMTPLSWTFIADPTESCLRLPAYAVGALRRSERSLPPHGQARFIQPFYGRIAFQANYFALLGDRLPGSTGQEIVANTLGRVPDGMEFHPSKRRYPVVAARFPWCFASSPRRVRKLGTDSAAWYRREIAAVGQQDLPAAIATFRQAQRQFEYACVSQGLVLFSVIQPLYAALTQLVDKAGVGDVGTLSGAFGVETSELVSDMWAASRGRLSVAQAAANHGYHGPMEGELSSRVWREDEAPLHRMVAEYAKRDDSEDPSQLARERIAARDHTAQIVLAALPASSRPAARLLMRLAAKHIPLRGIAKAAVLQALDVGRAAARQVGRHQVEAGVLRDVDDVFYLTFDELISDPTPEMQRVVELRKERRAEYLQLKIPPSWEDVPTPTKAGHSDRTVGVGDVVEGIGVSAGTVEGTARIVLDPDFMDVEPGEILVAPVTDPSWSSIMFISKALVVDVGGALGHAALVARELGIPCVVNTRDGTHVLKTGDHIRVDGDKGTVEILTPAPPS